MKKFVFQVLKLTYFSMCFWYLFTLRAHAYIDPSATTYIIQAVAGALIAIGAAFTIFRHKISAFFKKNRKNGHAEESAIEFKDVED